MVVSLTSQPLNSHGGSISPATSPGTLGGPQNRSGSFGAEINFLHRTGVEPRFLGRPIRSQVTVMTKPFRLPLGSKKKFSENETLRGQWGEKKILSTAKHRPQWSATSIKHFMRGDYPEPKPTKEPLSTKLVLFKTV